MSWFFRHLVDPLRIDDSEAERIFFIIQGCRTEPHQQLAVVVLKPFFNGVETILQHHLFAKYAEQVEHKKKIKSSLHSRYYAEAYNEWQVHLHSLAPGQHSSKEM